MNEIIGFIVLTSPLFLLILLVPVSLALGFFFTRKLSNSYSLTTKIVIGISISFLTVIIPFSDEIAGTVYFNHICSEMAGAKVYKTIELPSNYWAENGKPLFYDGNALPSKEYEEAGIVPEKIESTHLFRIEEFGSRFRDIEKNKIVGEVIGFRYWGGYIKRNFSLHNTAVSCGGGKSYDELVSKQFVPEEN
ncbi:MAG: hypothetical protein GY705_17530 [Bacteroidetes bacterium]|nr:hypothetical protein [Bacteroidota bacterium]